MVGNEDGKIEVSVGGVIMLAAATLAVTAVVFLLGVYVGKGVTEERLSSEQRIVRLPAPSAPGGGGGEEDTRTSFWDRLNDEEDETPSGPAAVPPEPTPTEAAVRVAPPEAVAPTPTAAPPPPTATVPPPPPPTPTPVAALRGTFQVQVQALSDEAAAERIVRDLGSRGYTARVSPAKIGAQTLYRVRVGPFPTEEEARAAISRLKGQGFPGAFLAAGGD